MYLAEGCDATVQFRHTSHHFINTVLSSTQPLTVSCLSVVHPLSCLLGSLSPSEECDNNELVQHKWGTN